VTAVQLLWRDHAEESYCVRSSPPSPPEARMMPALLRSHTAFAKAARFAAYSGALLAALGSGPCPRSGSTTGSNGTSVSGTWNGTVTASSGNANGGNLSLVLTQSGSQVTGTFHFTSTGTNSVTSSAAVTGSVSGSTLTFTSAQFSDSNGCSGAIT